ncbi:pentapeptide repeat-containing protein [Rhizobium sp. MHM7A]|uniref:pentapeptide repeat-containing protein n=1 Tax=Rhizobium sp. MHM7A TaxID=2583233 RepID=UPI001106FC49|nr:pentapeptide repeat-containing protein [Rhizobium sp. MHM7A]TLX17030.1 pentapeptide repeat-containing protein [Rhizobium sp. MHM7A]
MNNIRICDIDGNLMYEGRAKSRKAFVGELVRDGKSLARADLQGADLTHLNLDNGVFDGANLDGCDLRGTRAKRGNFSGASMRGIVGMGFMAKHASFKGAVFGSYDHPYIGRVPSRLDGAILQNANFDDAICEDTNFTWTSMSNTTFVNAALKNCNFYKSYLHNVEWGRSTVEACSFEEADLTPTYDALNRQHIPDRTIDARIIGNAYKHTKIGQGNAAFRNDSIWGRSMKFAYGAAPVLALAAAGTYVPMDIDFSIIKDVVGNAGWGFVGVTSALILMKDRIEDLFKDGFTNIAGNTTLKVRAAIQEMTGRGTALKNISVAVTIGAGGHALKAALAKENAPFAAIAANLSGSIDVIVANRKNLAVALHRISDTINGNRPKNQDVVVTRLARDIVDERIPTSMMFRRDGTIEAVWNTGNGTVKKKKWDIAGVPIVEEGAVIPQGPHNEHTLVLKKFADAILLDTNVLNFDFDPQTNIIHQGLDGSIVVTHRETGKLDNQYGPAIVTPADECFYFRQGGMRDRNFRRIKENQAEIPPGP